MGAFLHDMGKIDELAYDRGFTYTDEGQLIGHLVMAVGILERKLAEAERLSGEPVPPELALRLKHMIVSHHGQYEFGSPKLPMTLEAVALHHLDNLDAKLHSFAAADARRSERRQRLDQLPSRAWAASCSRARPRPTRWTPERKRPLAGPTISPRRPECGTQTQREASTDMADKSLEDAVLAVVKDPHYQAGQAARHRQAAGVSTKNRPDS